MTVRSSSNGTRNPGKWDKKAPSFGAGGAQLAAAVSRSPPASRPTRLSTAARSARGARADKLGTRSYPYRGPRLDRSRGPRLQGSISLSKIR